MKRKITDAELLAELEQGRTSREIAERWGMSLTTVNQRRQRIRFEATSIAVVSKPAAQKLVGAELDAIALLQGCMQRLVMLSDAYHEWLLDPAATSGEKYCIGPRATEIDVVYTTPGDHGRGRATLQELLNRLDAHYEVQSVERRCADPRTELRATVNAIGRLVEQMVELAQMLADARAMQVLRDSLLEELRQVDAGVAQRIVSRLRHRLVVSGAAGGSGAVDGPG